MSNIDSNSLFLSRFDSDVPISVKCTRADIIDIAINYCIITLGYIDNEYVRDTIEQDIQQFDELYSPEGCISYQEYRKTSRHRFIPEVHDSNKTPTVYMLTFFGGTNGWFLKKLIEIMVSNEVEYSIGTGGHMHMTDNEYLIKHDMSIDISDMESISKSIYIDYTLSAYNTYPLIFPNHIWEPSVLEGIHIPGYDIKFIRITMEESDAEQIVANRVVKQYISLYDKPKDKHGELRYVWEKQYRSIYNSSDRAKEILKNDTSNIPKITDLQPTEYKFVINELLNNIRHIIREFPVMNNHNTLNIPFSILSSDSFKLLPILTDFMGIDASRIDYDNLAEYMLKYHQSQPTFDYVANLK